MEINVGSRVTMHFALRLQDGFVAESSFDDEPVSFTMGDGTLDPGLEMALYGLSDGDRQTVTLRPGQAFGARDPQAVQRIARSRFPADMELRPGRIVGFDDDAGNEAVGAVLSVDRETVEMDFNHPLAGREFEFEVEIINVENPPAADD